MRCACLRYTVMRQTCPQYAGQLTRFYIGLVIILVIFSGSSAGDPALKSDTSRLKKTSTRHTNVNLLHLLGLEEGISKLNLLGWHLQANFNGYRIVSPEVVRFLQTFYGDFSLMMQCHLLKISHGSLVTIKQKKHNLPNLDLQVDLVNNTMTLRYLGVKSYQRVTIFDVFPLSKWSLLQVYLIGKVLVVRVDCGRNATLILKQRMAQLPEDAHVEFGHRSHHQKGLQGNVFVSTLSSYAEPVTEDCPFSVSDQEVADQPQKGTRLGSVVDRVNSLEQQVAELVLMLEALKTQNSELSSRVNILETCECHPSCSYEGVGFTEGQQWFPELCTVCQCVHGRPVCRTRMDIPSCASPCRTHPCQNAGSCLDVSVMTGGVSQVTRFQCHCLPPFTGHRCQVRQNPCIWPVARGNCQQELQRYYYDRVTQQCLPFSYSGCGGNINNYETIQQCVSVAMEGACCYRTFSVDRSSVVFGWQKILTFCKILHIGDCQELHRPQGGLQALQNNVTVNEETEVVGFYPGLSCQEINYDDLKKNCTVGQRIYEQGENFQLGCQQCTCLDGGIVNCTCQELSVRREIRDMTKEEIVRFQHAVAQLRLKSPDRIWEQFCELYMIHRMHASGTPFFLPWHRYFLRQLEQKLQEIDCGIVLPYFDFTTDVRNFSQAILWQANYFGSNGNKNDADCVLEHPFGDSKAWEPCLTRQFNTSVQLPTQIEIALALASDDFMEMSMCLETCVAYLHAYVGGDMMTANGPYDPVFYAVHAHIDMLYWYWQKRNANKFQFPAAYGSIPLIPFNIAPKLILDSEAALCVTYALPSQGNSCNLTFHTFTAFPADLHTSFSKVQQGNISMVSQHSNTSVTKDVKILNTKIDLFGLNGIVFDASGFDSSGYNQKGYNHDGYNREGFDVMGYNRYGYNREGYNLDGFNKFGKDQAGNLDTSGRYREDGFDAYCFNREGLNPHGYDKFGYSVEGYDADYCDFHFTGPFAPRQSLRIFEVLSKQKKDFLMSLPRTCPGLAALPDIWLKQTWTSEIKIISGLINFELPSSFGTSQSKRFCFDTNMFLTGCVCNQEIAICETNPCKGATCLAYPEAKCHVTFCGSCRVQWIYKEQEVNCSVTRDFCQPNPCLHGGSCEHSVWPNEPHLVMCVCPPGYDGHLCQYPVEDVCGLPLSTGSCEQKEMRWFYNFKTVSCEKFFYTGCHGNANNFATAEACEARCMIGACCFREPFLPLHTVGYDSQGYNRYGFNIEGFDRLGKKQTVGNGTTTPQYKQFNLNFDMDDFNEKGFNIYGYDHEGYDVEGFNLTGYNRIGEYDGIIDYDSSGFDPEGFNRAGYNCHGYSRRGYDVYGMLRGFHYKCRATTLMQCQDLESRRKVEIVQFIPGKKCSEVRCEKDCGCHHGNNTYQVGEKFQIGCQNCSCTVGGQIVCICDYSSKRLEVRELTQEKMEKFQTAVQHLASQTGHPSQWFQLADLYASYKPQAVGTPAFLPWNRRFLLEVERALRSVDCSLTLPYYDWTFDAGDPVHSIVWAANMFGGNGGWDECVRYHPFKKYYPHFWTPCLRRRFNESISLPDAVSVQLALNEGDYNSFRLHMELFAKLFQSFVGGHMRSDYAPYDPIFYSAMAYIDKLWDKWQHSHFDGFLQYPPEKRFLPMSPFGESPDDVMDLRVQVCTEYLTLTAGAPCNKSFITHFGYDTEGYDRHGYDRSGYNRDGYNVHGFDVHGNQDLLGKYNNFGYNRHGYSRSGYDLSGFDQFGFYIDSYNLDGFDPQGYDRSGYDRYGFDKQGYTPFGFHRNGSYKLHSEGINLTLFDPYGYNRFGLNKFGFDRDGYDIFGFDYRGLNRQMCNYFYLGPVYINVKRIVEEKLNAMNKNDIKRVHRLCSLISPLPEHNLCSNWLMRNKQQNYLEIIYDKHKQNHVFDLSTRPRNSSVLPDKIWFPVAPDDRFCINTNAFTSCQLDTSPVFCPQDLCVGLSCPGHPTGVCHINFCGQCQPEWYDGLTGDLINCTGCIDTNGDERNNGETWNRDICTICTCQGGMVECLSIDCGTAQCQYPVSLPDQCCPSCQGCNYNGQMVSSGHIIHKPNDPCSHCLCRDGNVECTTTICPDVSTCHSPVQPPGVCCHICLDCGPYADGDVWTVSPCLRCSCQRGDVNCEQIHCPQLSCEHPYTPDGECCPVCQMCFYQDNVYDDGEVFQQDVCTSCICHHGSVNCQTQDCPPTSCAKPVTLPDQCCLMCDLDCDYEDRKYKHKTHFTPAYNPCLNCSCNNSLVRCLPIHCPPADLPCSQAMALPGQCCPTVCPKCTHDGHEYNEGESWPSLTTLCEVCECRSGVTRCRQKQECVIQCTHGIQFPGQCCSQCTDCLYDGQVIVDGEKVNVPGSPCQECLCTKGNLECHTMPACTPLQCALYERQPGQCCPQCIGCDYRGQTFQYGDIVSKTACSQCICHEGQILCTDMRDACPPVPCQNPRDIQGHCCQICEGCDYYGRYYEDDQTFVSHQDPCQRCICQKGKVNCTRLEMECPLPPCTHPARVREQCCPQCRDCEYLRRLVHNGQRFSPPGGDPCSICVCQNGSVTCKRKDCPPVGCNKPVTPVGQCCPECPKCVMDRHEYMDGETFSHPRDSCSTCTCKDGEVSCTQQACPPTPCTHAATLPGECCPFCNFCLYDRRIFRSMQRFLNPNDLCQECICQQGSVSCKPLFCPELTCKQPIRIEGQCCLVCPKQCLYSGHLYNDGETFSSLTSSCDECLCRQGHVHCKRQLCPQVLCQHPGKDGCCFTCNGCSHGDIQVSHGQSFSDPQNTCHICTCQKGEISCQRQPCPATQCSHPALEDCCPVCASCDYNGLIVQSDTVFSDPQDNCRQCHCLAGNVRCQNQMCAPVKCKHPVKVGCCQDCSACRYKNHHYADNQTFSDPDNQCQECTCRHGTVVCQQRDCPPVTCDNPVQGPCCAECGNCQFQGHLLVDGQKAVHTSDPCKICHCLSGTVLCSPKECPLKQGCRYPVQRECCSLCTDCLYGGIEYKNGSRFSDKVECHVCQCLNGEVDCRHVTCPSLSCTHPAKEHCCPECSSCIYANRKYADGQRFSHPTERCQNCICEKGSVRCAPEDCSQAALCSHPVVVHGKCCPVCGQGCYFHSRIYQEEEKFEHECQECTCSQGNVHCVSLQCPPASCLHPVLEGCCWSCTDCLFESHHYKNGQIVPNSYDRCGECKCQNGSFQCTPRQCAPVDCMNPAPGICCPECIDCQMDGQHYANGQHFPSSDDHCSMCICQFGTVSCERVQCDAANCQNPILDICGCGSCHGCQFAGKKYRDGDIFDYPSDPCQICHCQSGSVNCAMRPCEKTCSHPVQVIGCCPHCSDCLFEGILRRENKSFVSEADPCQECVCRAGNVNCSTVTCPEVTCLKPLHLDHQCCPTCPVCKFFGQTYTDNSSFVHPKDPCNQCTCKEGRVVCEQEKCIIECTHPRQDKCCPQCDMCFYEEKLYTNGESFQPNICKRCLCLDGSVVCEEEKCPALNCLLMEQDPGHCCPKCKGCDYHEVHYMSNTSWLLPDNPCVSCACVGGLVTCMEVECYVPCSNPVTVLGQCCPVCPTCNYNGVSYSEGADFNPSDDPCDQCHCDKGYMQCIHETCPSVANCPSSNIVTPTPGECCPSCAGFSSGCTLADIGKITHPRPEEPCFYCECKEDFSWICMKEQCSVLSCPPDVQVSKPDQCCPLCPACFDKSDAHYYHEGEEWSSLANPCISCLCQGGEIVCTSQQCTSPICRVGEQLKLTAGHCCEMCVPVTDSACYYKGKHLESGTEWTVDVCTDCRCDSGAVYCNVQHCSITECGPDEAWVTSPGQCCPVCLKQPGTCVVFGDPHYRTFDGLTLHIQGTCRYVMAADCQKNGFSVEVQHDSRNTPGEVSWAQNFTIRIGTIEVELLQDGIVRVNATVVELPYLYEPYISLERNSHTVLLTTDIGLQVSWNGDSHAEVSIPGSFKSHVCGLCGNFNGFPHDDLRTRFGQITSSPAVFGNSWKASTQTETCYNSQDVDPCATAGYRIRKIATTRCSVIKGKAFSRCHRQVSPEPYFSSCVYDMCVCLEDPKCLCDILASYAHECARGGIKLEWRSHSLCAFECSEDKGFMFDECGPVCPRTCENFQTTLGNLTANCFKPCVPSCQCTADKVVHDGHCIKPANCPPVHLHTHN